MNRRDFLAGAAVSAAAMALPEATQAQNSDLQPIFAEIAKRHDEALQRLQNWIRQPRSPPRTAA